MGDGVGLIDTERRKAALCPRIGGAIRARFSSFGGAGCAGRDVHDECVTRSSVPGDGPVEVGVAPCGSCTRMRTARGDSAERGEVLGFSFRGGVPGISLRASTRGVRASVGPRAARLSVGSGGTRISSGRGPLYASSSLGGDRCRTTTRRTATRSRTVASSATGNVASTLRPLNTGRTSGFQYVLDQAREQSDADEGALGGLDSARGATIRTAVRRPSRIPPDQVVRRVGAGDASRTAGCSCHDLGACGLTRPEPDTCTARRGRGTCMPNRFAWSLPG